MPNCVSHHPWKEDYEKSMHRMGDKFSKLGKDFRRIKNSKKKKDDKSTKKEKKQKEVQEDEIEEDEKISVSSIK